MPVRLELDEKLRLESHLSPSMDERALQSCKKRMEKLHNRFREQNKVLKAQQAKEEEERQERRKQQLSTAAEKEEKEATDEWRDRHFALVHGAKIQNLVPPR